MGLFQIDYTKSGLSKLLGVVLLDSGFDDGPTIDVVDSGIGIPKERFPETILSLNENNKLKKSYVSGRFSQGGSSRSASANSVVIFSRSKHKADEVTFGNFSRIQVILSKPTGEALSASVAFSVEEKKQPNSKVVRGNIPDFDIIGVHPDDDADLWNEVWDQVPRDDAQAMASVAFKVLRAADKLRVYYSKVFAPFAAMVDKLKNAQPSLLTGFETNYKVWIGYHAILQQQQAASFSGCRSRSIDTAAAEARTVRAGEDASPAFG